MLPESWLFSTNSVIGIKNAQFSCVQSTYVRIYASTSQFILLVDLSVLGLNAIKSLRTMLSSWQTLAYKADVNWVPRSETIALGSPQWRQKTRINFSTTTSAVIVRHSSKITPFLSLSVITNRFVHPSLNSSSVIKSIKISLYILSRIGKGFKNPLRRSL